MVHPKLSCTQSKLDGAYLEWLVFGRKDEVESKWLQLDNTSPGFNLELREAKSALRASGVSSLDRTQTIYPVYFNPSDWYKYIMSRKYTVLESHGSF